MEEPTRPLWRAAFSIIALAMFAGGIASAAPSKFDTSDFKHEYSPTTPKSDPDLFRKWGRAGVARIDAIRIAAAKKASENPRCDNVELAELNDRASHPPSDIHVFVDCKNEQRFELSAKDLAGPLVTETEKGQRYSKEAVIDACTSSVRRKMNFPSTFSKDMFSTSARQARTTGAWVVEFTFNARNGFGLKLPGSALCTLQPNGTFDVQVTARR